MLPTELKKGQFLSSAGKIGIVTDIFKNEDETQYRIEFKSADSIVRYAADTENIPFLDWCTYEVDLEEVVLDIEAKKLLVTKMKDNALEFMATRNANEKLLLYGKTIPCYFVAEDGGDVFARSIYGNRIVMQNQIFSEIEKDDWDKAVEKYLAEDERMRIRRLDALMEELE